MSDFKSIPEGAIRVELERWGCGDECSCAAFRIYAVFPAKWRRELWESGWFHADFVEQDELVLLREDVTEACQHYGLTPLPSGDSWWDWEAERHLS